MGLFWEFYQQTRISDAESRATQAQQRTTSIEAKVLACEERLNAMTLACQAMWEILRERANITDDDIKAKMKEIDRRDGREDGRISATRRTCPRCHRPASNRNEKCLYCGYALKKDHVFQA